MTFTPAKKPRKPKSAKSPKGLRLTEFLKHSVAASDLAEYGYCPATITNMLAIGKIKSPVMMEGSRLHEEDAQKILSDMRVKKVKVPDKLIELLATMHLVVKNAIKKRTFLVNSDETKMYWAVLPELGCIGFPDLIDCKNGTPVVVERKKRILGNIPSMPWENHKLQLAIYMLSLERVGFKPKFGVLEYVKPATNETKRFEVPLNEDLRRKTLDAVEIVKGLIEGREPIPTTNPRKCERCNFADKCQWSLISNLKGSN